MFWSRLTAFVERYRHCTTDVHAPAHLCFYLTTMDVTPSTKPTSNDFAEVRYRSSTITSIVVAATVIVTLFYLAGLYLVAHRWVRDDTSLNKYSSVRLQRSAPCMTFFHPVEDPITESVPTVVYLLLVLTSIIEVGYPSKGQPALVVQKESDIDIDLDTRAVRL